MKMLLYYATHLLITKKKNETNPALDVFTTE